MPIRIRPISGYVCGLELTNNTDHLSITRTTTVQTAGMDYTWGWNTFYTCNDNGESCLAVVLLRGKKGSFIIGPPPPPIFHFAARSVPLWLPCSPAENLPENPRPTTGLQCLSVRLKNTYKAKSVSGVEHRRNTNVKKVWMLYKKWNTGLISYKWAAAVMSCADFGYVVFRRGSLGDWSTTHSGEGKRERAHSGPQLLPVWE